VTRGIRIDRDRIEVLLEDFGSVEVVCIDPLIIGCGISQPVYQVLSFTSCFLMIQDLLDFVFFFVIFEGRAGARRFSCGE
jgi:hypothetical protein